MRSRIRIPRVGPGVGAALGRSRVLVALLVVASAPPAARAQSTLGVRVEETAGIQRRAFPTSARLDLPQGAVSGTDQIQLVDSAGADVPVQGTAWASWPDGSVRDLEIDFNVTVGPFETRAFQLRYGEGVSRPADTGRGLLSVAEDASGIQVGRVRFNKSGVPLIASVAYRNELIVDGRNGVSVTDESGTRHGPSEISWSAPEVLKEGPLNVLIRYSGRLSMGRGSTDVGLDIEMPNSKSWVELTATVSSPGRRVRSVAIETPVSLGDYPWTWDFATPNGTYGAFRNAGSQAVFTRGHGRSGDGAWSVTVGPAGDQPYERSAPDWTGSMGGWTHFVGSTEAVAFSVETGLLAGTYTSSVSGSGQTSFTFAPATPAERTTLTVYEHYVSTPVPIGAATSPASILHPLRVRVEPQ